jgi:hypothetical protein
VSWRYQAAWEIMSAPAVTIAPGETVGQAGRVMHHAGVNRLLVTDQRRRLLGLIAAADLLKNFARSDEDLQAGVQTMLNPLAARINVHVHDGVVTLTGRVRSRRRRTSRVILHLPNSASLPSSVNCASSPTSPSLHTKPQRAPTRAQSTTPSGAPGTPWMNGGRPAAATRRLRRPPGQRILSRVAPSSSEPPIANSVAM